MAPAISDALADRHGLFLCVECGKCSAICPMGAEFPDYRYDISPRGIISRALMEPGFELDDHLWACLTCELCTSICPAGVRFRDFVLETREVLMEAGHREHAAFCGTCKTYLGPRHTTAHLEKTLGADERGLLSLCDRCRRRDIAARFRDTRCV